jgi:molybdopterin synthase catalytic subunit
VGDLAVNEQIVLVITTSKHRKNAFDACEFMMDYLKTQAPFSILKPHQ